MNDSGTYVLAAGMACPVGLGWLTATAAMRAGIARKVTSDYRDNQGREIVASFLREGLPAKTSRDERWLHLLACALRDLTRGPGVKELAGVRLFLATPKPQTTNAGWEAFLSKGLSAKLGIPIHPEQVARIEGSGAYAGLAALNAARASVQRGRPAVVAAADSLVSAQVLLRLSRANRLLVEENSDGVIPGEAAVAVWLTDRSQGALGRVRSLGFGKEPARLDNDVPLLADGLVGAARQALAEAGMTLNDVDFRVSDAAGESFFFKEQSLAVSRLLRQRKQELPLWLPAEPLGDTGKAATLCGLVWAMAGWARGYAPGGRVMGFAGNDAGQRAVTLLERVGENR